MFLQLLAIVAYLVGPAPRYFWCESREYYRYIGNILQPYPVDTVIPEEYKLPELYKHNTSLFGDIFNNYFYIVKSHHDMYRNTVQAVLNYLHSPITYGVCPNDPTPFFWEQMIITWLLCTAVIIAIFNICWNFAYLPVRYYLSVIVSKTNQTVTKPAFYRSSFSNMITPEPIILDGHSHPKAAAYRNADSLMIRRFALSVGLEPYYIQCSAADQRRGSSGSRSYYWGKDLASDPSPIEPSENSMLAFVDVDQYIDMPFLLAHNTKPVMVATVQPTCCSGTINNFSFTFDTNSVLHYYVSGSATYEHPVWNYNTDTITAVAKLFGIPYSSTIYNVDKRTTSAHHDVILLTPIGHWGLMTTLVNYLTIPDTLKRYNLMRGTHLRLRTKTKDDLMVSTSRPLQFACANTTAQVDDTIANLAVVSKNGLTRPSIESHLPKATTDAERLNNAATATILFDYHIHNNEKYTPLELLSKVTSRLAGAVLFRDQPIVVSPVEPNPAEVRRYQFKRPDDEAKPLMVAFMQPIVNLAFSPDKTIENEQVAVQKRILEVASNAQDSPFITTLIQEFVERMIPVPHLLLPVDHEEVHLRQARPTQRKLLDEAADTLDPKRILKTFIKAEAYPDAKAPRIISTYNSKDKMEYSRYMYAFSDWMKTHDWYAFGKTPKEVSESIVSVCSEAEMVTITDFSKLDGTVSIPARALEKAILYRTFQLCCHTELQDLHQSQYNLFAVCSKGTNYKQGTARGSGSPETSAFNSTLNAFCTFAGHRMSRENGAYLTADDAWNKTKRGQYGGDDGLSPDINVDAYTKACTKIGLTVKAEPILRGQFGVKFLSRIYGPDVWTGDISNCCDIVRQIGKVHVSHVRNGVSNQQMLVDKMIGFQLTDSNTPLIGPFANKVMQLNNNQYTPDLNETTWLAKAKLTNEEQDIFSNPPRDWYLAYVRDALPTFDHESFNKWINSLTNLNDCLTCPKFMETIPATVPKDLVTIVDGETYTPITQPLKPLARDIYLANKTAKLNNRPRDPRPAFNSPPPNIRIQRHQNDTKKQDRANFFSQKETAKALNISSFRARYPMLNKTKQ